MEKKGNIPKFYFVIIVPIIIILIYSFNVVPSCNGLYSVENVSSNDENKPITCPKTEILSPPGMAK